MGFFQEGYKLMASRMDVIWLSRRMRLFQKDVSVASLWKD